LVIVALERSISFVLASFEQKVELGLQTSLDCIVKIGSLSGAGDLHKGLACFFAAHAFDFILTQDWWRWLNFTASANVSACGKSTARR
jgi:hypothetical protein